jgi:hypothetical protein
MRRSRCVPLAFLIVASLSACDQMPMPDPVEADYVAVETGRLLSLCAVAPSARASSTIGLLGGSVKAGGVTMTVPPGAVAAPTEFRLHVPSSTHAEVEIHANGEEHYQFLAPVVIAMDYSRCTTGSGSLAVWHIDPETKSLLENMGGIDDVLNQRVIFSTMHLSGYAIAN